MGGNKPLSIPLEIGTVLDSLIISPEFTGPTPRRGACHWAKAVSETAKNISMHVKNTNRMRLSGHIMSAPNP